MEHLNSTFSLLYEILRCFSRISVLTLLRSQNEMYRYYAAKVRTCLAGQRYKKITHFILVLKCNLPYVKQVAAKNKIN